LAAIDPVLKDYRVDGWLSIEWEKQVEWKTQYVGRGRGAAGREQRGIKHIRYPITHSARQGEKIAELPRRFGGKALGTKAGRKRRSWKDAVLCYRNAYRVERVFHRLKSCGHIAPLVVKLNDPIEGLTYRLT